MKINPFIYGIIVLALFFGVIGAAKATDNWTVSGKISAATGEKVMATGTNPDEIKGWMTLADISKSYNVPLAEILAQFQLPADTPGTKQLKELESSTFETSLLREWLKAKPGQ